MLSSEAVCLLYGFVVPVSPVHPLLEDSDGKGVWHGGMQHNVPVCAVQVRKSDRQQTRRTGGAVVKIPIGNTSQRRGSSKNTNRQHITEKGQ